MKNTETRKLTHCLYPGYWAAPHPCERTQNREFQRHCRSWTTRPRRIPCRWAFAYKTLPLSRSRDRARPTVCLDRLICGTACVYVCVCGWVCVCVCMTVVYDSHEIVRYIMTTQLCIRKFLKKKITFFVLWVCVCVCGRDVYDSREIVSAKLLGKCSVLRCVAVCCSALWWVAVCCSVLQCVAAYDSRETVTAQLCIRKCCDVNVRVCECIFFF